MLKQETLVPHPVDPVNLVKIIRRAPPQVFSKGSSLWKRILYVQPLEMEVVMILPGARMETMKYGSSTSSLIDVVFLLLIYFMVTASLIKKEGDIGFMIPVADSVKIPDIPVEVLIEVHESGIVELEGQRFASTDRTLDDLIMQIAGLKQIAASQGSKFFVNIKPDPDALHFRIIDVMDACAYAKVETLGFAKSN